MERIKEYIEKVVEKLTKDDELREQFKTEPVKALEKVLGVDLPDDLVEGIITGVKAKLTKEKVSDLLGKFKDLL